MLEATVTATPADGAPSAAMARPGHSPVLATVEKYWGYKTLRPLQAEAIRAGIDHRDSLVVMPTGGGKSLCYQVPPIVAGRTDVVVSPLISLMKDQVDGLRACGYPAVALNSGMSADERREAWNGALAGKYRLIFVAPERLMVDGFAEGLSRMGIRAFAIDEAHCISHWGHDFRREYRQLAGLRRRFPDASFHAYTATATQRVRDDIVRQLGLREPAVLVGSFDRPNLVYRVVQRVDVNEQVLDVLARHREEAVIIYCISRRETESLAGFLMSRKLNAACYHAGMNPEDRRRTQEAFAAERLNIVVATVAFGMGIDRSNVRCVIHTAMPKSIEHYQQETGRAGRDGLEAECILLYSSADAAKWTSMIVDSAQSAQAPEDVIRASTELLEHLRAYCQPFHCRHRKLVEYFQQTYPKDNCGACDVCLGESVETEDATLTAQKILSCVARVEERFGVKHVVDVLCGGDTEMVRRWRHDRLSTYGLLTDTPRKIVSNMTNQLVDLGLLDRTRDEYRTLRLNAASWEVLRGNRQVLLPKQAQTLREARDETASWVGVDRGLFSVLKALRTSIATEQEVPPFVVFSDVSLRDMARRRPRRIDSFRRISGVGETKLAAFGPAFVARIDAYCTENGLDENMTESPGSERPARERRRVVPATARKMFDRGASIEVVMAATGRARSTVCNYLGDYILETGPKSIDRWIKRERYEQIAAAAMQLDLGPFRPVYEKLGGAVPYDEIRLVVSHLQARTHQVT